MPKGEGPAWREGEDAIMYEAMSEGGESIGHVEKWLDQQNAELNSDNYAEPMDRGNHGASDRTAREQLWRLAQCQADKDGKPRIPTQPSIKELPDVASQDAKRHGVSTE